MKKWLDYGLPTLFVIFYIGAIVIASIEKPRVFVVMSYDQNNLWESEIRQGLTKALDNMNQNFNFTFFYMNTKNFNSPEYLKNTAEKVKKQIRSWHPDVVLLVDDDPQQYIGKDLIDKPNFKVVFTGVANPAAFGYVPHKNVTGVVKKLAFASSKDALQSLFPQYKTIINLSDASVTSHYFYEQFMSFNWSPLQVLGTYMTNSFAEWQQIVELANQKNALLLITLYHTVTSGSQRVLPQQVMLWTLQHARVPMFGFFDIFAEDGGPVAIALSGNEQGELSAKMLVRILLNKENPGDIPFTQNQHIKFAMNPHSMSINIPHVKIPTVLDSLAFVGNSIYGPLQGI